MRLSGGQVGLRRAEFEGQIDRLREHPELLGLIADAFADANPDAPELVTVQMVHRKFELADGEADGRLHRHRRRRVRPGGRVGGATS